MTPCAIAPEILTVFRQEHKAFSLTMKLIKATLKTRMDEVASKAIRDLKIGDLSLGVDALLTDQTNDIQSQLLQETRQKLFGINISARGSILSFHDELWFFASQIQLS